MSYAHGFLMHSENSSSLWGGIPDQMKSFYTTWMFVAAASYFLFTHFLLFRVKPKEVNIAGRFGYNVLNSIYVLILAPSALWMPLTFMMIAHPSHLLWLAIRLALWCVALGSITLVLAILFFRPRKPSIPYWLALLGGAAFAIQTAILDAIIWVIHFPA
jgi:hypothetical protein